VPRFKVFRYSFFGTIPNFLNRLLDSLHLVGSTWNLQYLLVLDWTLTWFTFCENRYLHDNDKQKSSKTVKLKFCLSLSWRYRFSQNVNQVKVQSKTNKYCKFHVVSIQFFWDHTKLFESALRQSSSCRINVKFAILVNFGLNFNLVYILWKSISPWQRWTKILENSQIEILCDPDFTLKSKYQHLKLWCMANKICKNQKNLSVYFEVNRKKTFSTLVFA